MFDISAISSSQPSYGGVGQINDGNNDSVEQQNDTYFMATIPIPDISSEVTW